MMTDEDEFKAKFKLVCRKCESENVVVNFEPACDYSEHTVSSGSASFRCADCQTDIVICL